MNKPVYLGLTILKLSKNEIYEFCYDYVEPKYEEKPKLCYMDTHSFIAYIKTEDIYLKTAKDVEARFDTSNYESDRPLMKGKIKKVIGLTLSLLVIPYGVIEFDHPGNFRKCPGYTIFGFLYLIFYSPSEQNKYGILENNPGIQFLGFRVLSYTVLQKENKYGHFRYNFMLW